MTLSTKIHCVMVHLININCCCFFMLLYSLTGISRTVKSSFLQIGFKHVLLCYKSLLDCIHTVCIHLHTSKYVIPYSTWTARTHEREGKREMERTIWLYVLTVCSENQTNWGIPQNPCCHDYDHMAVWCICMPLCVEDAVGPIISCGNPTSTLCPEHIREH